MILLALGQCVSGSGLKAIYLNKLTFYNFNTSGTFDMSNMQITVNTTVYEVSNLSVESGSKIIPAHGSVTLTGVSVPSDKASIALWLPGTFPNNPTSASMVDFAEFGAAGMSYESFAVKNSFWISGTFVDDVPPLIRSSDFSQRNAGQWSKLQTSVPNLPGSKVSVYPNPFNEAFLVETDFTNGVSYELRLTDSRGSEVMSIKGIRERNIRVESADLPRGMYYLRIISETGDSIILPVIKR